MAFVIETAFVFRTEGGTGRFRGVPCRARRNRLIDVGAARLLRAREDERCYSGAAPPPQRRALVRTPWGRWALRRALESPLPELVLDRPVARIPSLPRPARSA